MEEFAGIRDMIDRNRAAINTLQSGLTGSSDRVLAAAVARILEAQNEQFTLFREILQKLEEGR
jgi:hypothetical protein